LILKQDKIIGGAAATGDRRVLTELVQQNSTISENGFIKT